MFSILNRAQSSRKPPWNVLNHKLPQNLVSQAGKKISRKPAWLKAFSFQNYQYDGKYIVLLLNANVKLTHNWILY